jgi:hypothetical protein
MSVVMQAEVFFIRLLVNITISIYGSTAPSFGFFLGRGSALRKAFNYTQNNTNTE